MIYILCLFWQNVLEYVLLFIILPRIFICYTFKRHIKNVFKLSNNSYIWILQNFLKDYTEEKKIILQNVVSY